MSVKDQDTGLNMFGPFPEESDVVYSATLKDSSSNTITAVSSMKLTLYEKKSGIILNGRKEQNILNLSGGTFSDGSFTFNFDENDTKMISKRNLYEDHVARFTYTYDSGTKTGRHAIVIKIQNVNVGVV